MASHLVGSLITCSEGCVGPGLSLAWTAWLRLRCNTLPMKEFGDLIVCSGSNSSENYWCMVEPRLQPCVAEDISPVSNLALSLKHPFRVISLHIPSLLAELRRCHFA
jgi:hypothetical protein